MQELTSTAILIATLFGGMYAAKKISDEVRLAVLTKTAHGLPSLKKFSHGLTKNNHEKNN